VAVGKKNPGLYHVIVECPWAKHFWSEVKKLTGSKLPVLHTITWATDVLQGSLCSLADVALFVCGGWSLWSSRNGREHGQNRWNPIAAAKHVANLVEEMLCLGKRADCLVPKSKERWRLSEERWVKVNTDGSFDACVGHGVGAAVLRDHHGEVHAAQARCFGLVHEALVTSNSST
jgi:hypothetical protein